MTLVPDAPEAITSDTGWDTKANMSFLTEVIDEFTSSGVRTSIFVNPAIEMIEYAAKTRADRVELYTGPYAEEYVRDKEKAIDPYIQAAKYAKRLGLGINAGHDLSLDNLNYFYVNIPIIDEVSIGHALISEALYLGLEKTIAAYKNALKKDDNLNGINET